jgi:hypothetical protein
MMLLKLMGGPPMEITGVSDPSVPRPELVAQLSAVIDEFFLAGAKELVVQYDPDVNSLSFKSDAVLSPSAALRVHAAASTMSDAGHARVTVNH